MKGHPIQWTAAELAWIEGHRTLPRARLLADFQAEFGRPEITKSNLASLCKRNGWLTGRTGRYAPGSEPANKGKKMPYNANSARTQFKKGQRPHTWRGAGHERIDPQDGYVVMIVDEPNPWTGAATRPVHKHRWLWEQKHGPIPEDHVLKCKSGDKTDCNPANWELIPRALLPRLNGRFGRGYDEASPEVKPAIMAIAKLEHRARELRQSMDGGDQDA